jgi:hypothetical protein
MAAVADALDPKKQNQKLENIQVLNLGTGSYPLFVEGNKDSGVLGWAPLLIPLLFDGSEKTTVYICDKVLGDNYFHLDVLLKKQVELDDVDAIPFLIEAAEKADLSKVVAWIKEKGWCPS